MYKISDDVLWVYKVFYVNLQHYQELMQIFGVLQIDNYNVCNYNIIINPKT